MAQNTSSIKRFFNWLWERYLSKSPFIEIWGAIWILAMIAFAVSILSFASSSIYYPVRIYFTGVEMTDTVKRNYVANTTTRSGTMSTGIIIGTSGYEYEGTPADVKKLKEKEVIRVFKSEKLKRGVWLGDNKPGLFIIMLNYHTYGIVMIIFCVIGLIGLLTTVAYQMRETLINIYINTRLEAAASTQPINMPLAYAKAYVQFFLALYISYQVTLLVIRGVYATEGVGEYLTGCILSLGLILIVTTPFLINWFRQALKKLAQQKGAVILQLIGFLYLLHTAYKLIRFPIDNPLSKYENILPYIKDILETFIPG